MKGHDDRSNTEKDDFKLVKDMTNETQMSNNWQKNLMWETTSDFKNKRKTSGLCMWNNLAMNRKLVTNSFFVFCHMFSLSPTAVPYPFEGGSKATFSFGCTESDTYF